MAVSDPKFNIGDRVRVVSARHTERVGWVRQISWHFKHQCYYYFIEVAGKTVPRRKVSTAYAVDELEIAD